MRASQSLHDRLIEERDQHHVDFMVKYLVLWSDLTMSKKPRMATLFASTRMHGKKLQERGERCVRRRSNNTV